MKICNITPIFGRIPTFRYYAYDKHLNIKETEKTLIPVVASVIHENTLYYAIHYYQPKKLNNKKGFSYYKKKYRSIAFLKLLHPRSRKSLILRDRDKNYESINMILLNQINNEIIIKFKHVIVCTSNTITSLAPVIS